MIDPKSLRSLEYDRVKELLANYASSSCTREFIKNEYVPFDVFSDCNDALRLTAEADIILFSLAVSVNLFYDDVAIELDAATKNSTLSAKEILKIALLLKNSRLAKTTIEKLNDERLESIYALTRSISIHDRFENDVEKCILGDNEISDGASVRLSEIRREIKSVNSRIVKKLQEFISTKGQYLQDALITVRDGRQVLPVKSECRSQIPGLIHDQSQSGSTVYIEPFIIVEMNNDLKRLYIDEKNEIERILHDFSSRIKAIASDVRINFEAMRELDLVFARAEFAHATSSSQPTLNDKGLTDIKKGRHPLIDKDKVVPVSVKLGGEYDFLLITGSNTGGKTVSLKLVGLFTLMAMSGMFIPAEYGSAISFYDGIYCDIGDDQSIEQSLSTFSSHIANLKYITASLDGRCLILLDELGAGTDPSEGAALAIATCEYLLDKDCQAIVTTHYNELKEFAFVSDRAQTAAMDFDPKTFAPTYKLIMGIVGNSNAIEIASRLGLDCSIIDNARGKISEEKKSFDRLMSSAEEARKQAEEYLKEAEAKYTEASNHLKSIDVDRAYIAEERKKLNENARKEAKKLLEEYTETAEELLEELKEAVKENDEKALFEARNLRRKLEKIEYKEENDADIQEFAEGNIGIGDDVFINSLNNRGTVVGKNDKKREYAVKVGIITTNVKYEDVKRLKKTAPKSTAKVSLNRRLEPISCPLELNVIGQNTDEAVYNVDEYLDKAVIAGLETVRIVHGKGNGILRKNIREHLRKHPSVDSYKTAEFGEGDAGVTVVKMK